MTYATKDNIDVATSALTIGGFTQPDRLVEILQSLLSRVYDGAQKGIEADAVIEPDSEGSDDEEDELMEPIVTQVVQSWLII